MIKHLIMGLCAFDLASKFQTYADVQGSAGLDQHMIKPIWQGKIQNFMRGSAQIRNLADKYISAMLFRRKCKLCLRAPKPMVGTSYATSHAHSIVPVCVSRTLKRKRVIKFPSYDEPILSNCHAILRNVLRICLASQS